MHCTFQLHDQNVYQHTQWHTESQYTCTTTTHMYTHLYSVESMCTIAVNNFIILNWVRNIQLGRHTHNIRCWKYAYTALSLLQAQNSFIYSLRKLQSHYLSIYLSCACVSFHLSGVPVHCIVCIFRRHYVFLYYYYLYFLFSFTFQNSIAVQSTKIKN